MQTSSHRQHMKRERGRAQLVRLSQGHASEGPAVQTKSAHNQPPCPVDTLARGHADAAAALLLCSADRSCAWSPSAASFSNSHRAGTIVEHSCRRTQRSAEPGPRRSRECRKPCQIHRCSWQCSHLRGWRRRAPGETHESQQRCMRSAPALASFIREARARFNSCRHGRTERTQYSAAAVKES